MVSHRRMLFRSLGFEVIWGRGGGVSDCLRFADRRFGLGRLLVLQKRRQAASQMHITRVRWRAEPSRQISYGRVMTNP